MIEVISRPESTLILVGRDKRVYVRKNPSGSGLSVNCCRGRRSKVEGTEIRVCKYDYMSNGLTVEAITYRPAGEGRFPAVLMIPGFQRTALDLIPLGVALAREGIASVGISQPGFGRSR